MTLLRRSALPLLALAFMLGMIAPAQAAGGGTLGLNLTAQYSGGTSGPLAGALVTAENLDTALVYPVPAYGDPATSAYYNATGLPFGRYRLRIERMGFATTYWPQQFSREAAAVVTFGNAPGCNPADAATCDLHILTAQVPQLVTLSGAVRHRTGAGASGVPVTATRDGETSFHPTVTTSGDGSYALQLPPGSYRLTAPNRQDTVAAQVSVTGTTTRDLVLHDVPGPVRDLRVATGNRQAAVSWSPPADDGGTPVTTYTVTALPGAATCSTSALSCTLTDLDSTVEYTFRVTATNAVGTGPFTDTTVPVRANGRIPQPPTNVRLTAGDRTLDVTWSASVSDDVREYVATAAPGGKSCSTADLACRIAGLRNGRAYSVSVTAIAPAGSSAPAVAERPRTPSGPPAAPRNVRTTPASSALKVQWQPPRDDGGRPIEAYVATAWPGGRTCDTAKAVRCTIRNLRPGTAYSVTVRAENASGVGAVSPGSTPVEPLAGPGTPAKVTKLRVRTRGASLTASWRPVKHARSYWVRLTADSPTPWMVVRSARATFAAAPGVTAVQVKAVGPGGPGPIATRPVR